MGGHRTCVLHALLACSLASVATLRKDVNSDRESMFRSVQILIGHDLLVSLEVHARNPKILDNLAYR